MAMSCFLHSTPPYTTVQNSQLAPKALLERDPRGSKQVISWLPKKPFKSAVFWQQRNQTHHHPLTVQAWLGIKPKKPTKQVRETVVPDPDFRLPLAFLGAAAAFGYNDNLLAAAPFGLLGLLLAFQTTRVRFVFDDEALEVKIGNSLEESGENVFVGGKNKWKYSTFVNWELWWPNFPILVYFKETQTKPEGQVHFFPVIFNGKQLYDVMVERAGPSKTSGPK